MSGGRFNYLCFRESEEDADLGGMRDALAKYHGAEKALSMVDELMRARSTFDALRDVFHAVEWCESGDTSEQDVANALAKFNKEHP